MQTAKIDTAAWHSYRVFTIPADTPADEVERCYNAKKLPFLEFRAPNGEKAAKIVNEKTGRAVHSVQRIEGD